MVSSEFADRADRGRQPAADARSTHQVGTCRTNLADPMSAHCVSHDPQ
jgi:hypothetical protein